MSLCQTCLGGPREIEVPRYQIGVCKQCWRQAEQGWPEHFEGSLRQAMARQGLLIPDRNPQGRWPRDYLPPADFNL